MSATSFLRRIVFWTILSVLVGFLAGSSSALFLSLLQLVTSKRESQPAVIGFLPVAGLAIGFLYYFFGREVVAGNNLILDEIHDPKKIIPLRMNPLILISTLLTHLVGGSAGREGTAVQMSASLSDQLSKIFKVGANERRILLMAGMGAGFGSAIGAPLAGSIFGMEVLRVGRIRYSAWWQSLIASYVAYYTVVLFRVSHSEYPPLLRSAIHFDFENVSGILIAAVGFGLAAIAFIRLTHAVERFQTKFISFSPVAPLVGGLILLALYQFEGSIRYSGLGISTIQHSMIHASAWFDSVLKMVFTSITLGFGFKGGEFIPLVFIGATLGSFLSGLLPVSVSVLSSLGFAATFGAASNTPLACAVMAMELFGYAIGPYALLSCFVSYWVAGNHRIYRSQKSGSKFWPVAKRAKTDLKQDP